MFRRHTRLQFWVQEVCIRHLGGLHQSHPILCCHRAEPLSSSSNLGLDLEKFAANLKHKLQQQKAQKPPEDIPGLYQEASARVKDKGRHRKRKSGSVDPGQEWAPSVGGLDLDFSFLDSQGNSVEKRLEDADRMTFRRQSSTGEGDEEKDELGSEVDSSFKRRSNEELLRRIRHVSEGRVMRLPTIPDGPKMRVRIPPESTPTGAIPYHAFHPNFRDTPVGEYILHLGCAGEKFERICERNPKALHGNVEELKASLKIALNYMSLSDKDLVDLICGAPKLLTCKPKDVEARIQYIRKKLRLNKSDLKTVMLGCPDCFHEQFESDFEASTSFLDDELGIGLNLVRLWALDFPMFVSIATKEKLESVLGFFKRRFEFKSVHLVNALKREPRLVAGEIDKYLKIKNWIVKYGLSNEQGKTLFRENPEILLFDLKNMIIKVLDWFHMLGYKRPNILRIVTKQPQVLSYSLELMDSNVYKLKALNFTPEEIRLIFLRAPILLSMDLNAPDVEYKINFMVHALGRSIKDLINFPQYLTCSMEDRIVARVEFLRSIGRLDITAWPLQRLYGGNDQAFCINHAHKPWDRYKAFREEEWRKNKADVLEKWIMGAREKKKKFIAANYV